MVTVIAFISVFTVVVLVHELGHYLAARLFNIPVYEFSIGFPFSPKVATLFRIGETSFTLRFLPIGGFVSFAPDGSDSEGAEFLEQKRWKRAVIAVAGPAFNALFALVLFVLVFSIHNGASFMEAVLLSIETFRMVISGTVDVIGGLFTGTGISDNLSGPIGIAVAAGQAAGAGAVSLLYFTAVLSLSLGILNLLPLPALDGGHLVILSIESILKRSLPEKAYVFVGAVGMLSFLILTVFVSYYDIIKLVA